jgi:glycosyltransferase involved in cell wall biosynthesis
MEDAMQTTASTGSSVASGQFKEGAGKPRILIVNWRDPKNPQAGGAEVHLHEVARRLVAEGFPVIQYSHAFAGAPSEELIDGVRVIRRGGAMTFNFTVWLNLRRWCAEHRIDAVLDDSNKIAFFAPWTCDLPVVLQLHHLFGRAVFRETAWPLGLYVLLFEKIMPWCYRNTVVLTGSASSRAELLEKGFRNVSIAPEGVDPADCRIDNPPARDPNLLLYVGRVKRYKGLDTLLHALALLRARKPAVRLAIAGSGDDVPRLKELAVTLGIADAVDFAGFVSARRKAELYYEASVVLNSSRKEGWGLTSIEGNACGAPVVATNVPGLCDSVRDGETGFLVPFGDAPAFAAATERLLDDPALWHTFSDNGRRWAAAHTWEPAFEVTRDALLSVLKHPKA